MLVISMTNNMVVNTMVGMPNVMSTFGSHLNWGLSVLHFGGKLFHGDTAHHGDGVKGGVDGVWGLAQDKVGLHGSTMKARGASLS